MSRFRRTYGPLLALAVAVLALGVAGCGDDSDDSSSDGGTPAPAPAPAEPTQQGAEDTGGPNVRSLKIEILDFEFSPPSATIATGGKITWLNQGEAPHDATADDGSFGTGTLAPGKLKSETFKEPGTYAYICTIHPQMEGTIEVVG